MGTTAATVALVYPGQGGYTPGVLARLARRFPEAEPELARIRATWLAETGEDLSTVLADTNSDLAALSAASRGLSQVAMFAASVALHRALANRAPGDLIHVGHSFGEIAALTCAGVWSVEDGTRIAATRGRCLAALPARAGAMTAVSGSSERIEQLVRTVDAADLVVAGHNGPGQVVVSGPIPAIRRFEAVVGVLGIRRVRIPSRYPFHSPLLAGAVAAFAEGIREIGWMPPRQPVYSSVAGRAYRPDDDLAGMLAGHLVRPFDFGAAVRAQYAQGIRLFLECGGERTLTSAIRRTLGAAGTSDWRAVAGDELPDPAAAALHALAGMRRAGRGEATGALAA